MTTSSRVRPPSLVVLACAAAVLAVVTVADGCRGRGRHEPARAAAEAGAPTAAATAATATAAAGAGAAPSPAAIATAAAPPQPAAPHLPRIDVHMHISPDAVDRALALMDRWGIDGAVNLSGMYPGPPNSMLERQLAAARAAQGRIAVFANANFRHVQRRKDYGQAMAVDLEESRRLGAVGLKIPKGLGLGYPAPGGQRLLAVDDPGLDPLFEKAGELGMPVAIHVGDPKAFWRPPNAENERWDELRAHPEWSFYGQPVPSWEELYAAFERRVARHRKTNFIAVHFGNDPEDPDRVARMLDKYRNFYIDTAARVPEIGRHPQDKMRRFYQKYQDRVLLGTDTGVGATQADMMYGSNGEEPATEADEQLFFRSTWRYFETPDRQFESPTPIQGRWKIDGVGLPEKILRKIYFENAARVLKWKPPAPAASAAPAPAAVPAPTPAASPPPPAPALAPAAPARP